MSLKLGNFRSRKWLLIAAVCIILIVTVPIFGLYGPDLGFDWTGGRSQDVYNEAPMLAEMVSDGTLPPVEDRLPTNPMLIQPNDEVGVYGGTWRMANTYSSASATIRVYTGYENLLRFDPNWARVIPNLAQSYDVNEDASEYTFHLREGLKWSDGAPFTADDIVFWYEADFLNNELHSSFDSNFVIDGVPVVVEKIDNTTVIFRFAGPYPRFPETLADVASDSITAAPMHYLKQFHIDYNPEGINQLINEANAEDWKDLWKKKNTRRNPERPNMHGWILTESYTSSSEFIMMERNPFYWKIDTNYNQLPYIDNIKITICNSTDEIFDAMMSGKVDMQHRVVDIASRYDEFVANMATGGYTLHTTLNPRANYLAVQFNLVHKDPVLRSVFTDKSFRIALSQAINRTEMVDQIFVLT